MSETEEEKFLRLIRETDAALKLRQKRMECSFCGKNAREVSYMVAGPRVFICDECNGLVTDIIQGQKERQAKAVEGFAAGVREMANALAVVRR